MKKTRHKKTEHRLLGISLLGFLFTIQYTIPVYINSSFLTSITSEVFFGFVYPIASLLTILVFVNAPHFLHRFGNYKTSLVMFMLNMATFLVMAFVHIPAVIITAFIINFAVIAFTFLSFDIILEHDSTDQSTGTSRGIFFTSLNTAWLFGPLIGSFILAHGNYWHVYTTSAIVMIPVLFLFHYWFRDFSDPPYIKSSLWKTFRKVSRNKDVYRIFMTKFLMHFFFAVMIIYTPIYLNAHIGLSWETIGLILFIALLPFAILEAPLGHLADTRWGEKEMLSIGFLITGGATILMSLTSTSSPLVWTLILVATRIGASMIEIMTESYLFKKIGDTNINIMSLFRTMRPWAYLSAPLLISLVLLFIDIRYIFALAGIVILYGLRYSLTLKDTC